MRNFRKEFDDALGSEEKGIDLIDRYDALNGGGSTEKAMADGVIYTLITQYALGRVVLLEVLGVGTGR